jgi:hypothetical protein
MTNRWRKELPRPSRRIARLPLDKRGYPIPWFAARFQGEPDFRVYDPAKFSRALKERRCWVCGEKLGAYGYFVVSPYCVVSRTSTEPPCHEECAEFSVQGCPFLTGAEVRRRAAALPEESFEAAGLVVEESPAVVAIWATLGYEVVATERGPVCKLGDPVSCRWFKQGRKATRSEVLEAIERDFPALGLGQSERDLVMRLYDRTN